MKGVGEFDTKMTLSPIINHGARVYVLTLQYFFTYVNKKGSRGNPRKP